MGDQGEGRIQHVRKKEHNRKRTAEPAETLLRHPPRGFKGHRQNQCDRRKRQHRRLRAGADRIKVLLRIRNPPASMAAPSTSSMFPTIEPAIDASTTS